MNAMLGLKQRTRLGFARAPTRALAPTRKIGVLLCNLGTPDGTDYGSVRRYLKEFLSDRRVIEWPRPLRWLLLHALVLPLRPRAKGKDYARIWNTQRDESPLKTITRAQADKLQSAFEEGLLGDGADEVIVEWGMRYGNPSLKSALDQLLARGCERVLLVPLYPQYSAASTATASDKLFDALRTYRQQPSIRVAGAYFDEPAYIEEVARSVVTGLSQLDFDPEVILASFHGMPAKTRDLGDPYYEQCLRTTALLRKRLGLSEAQFMASFQSRFGAAPWLQPYTAELVRKLAQRGVKRLVVVTPGFSADCLETIDEIGREVADVFLEAGGESFARIACLNDEDGGMRVIESVVMRELQGWL
jgi:ferrochelatase